MPDRQTEGLEAVDSLHPLQFAMIKNLIYFLQYLCFRLLTLVNNLLPYEATAWLADLCGKIGFSVARKKREIALNNIRNSFPEKTEAEVHEIAVAAFQNIFHTGSEVARIPQIHENPELYLETQGFEKLGEALKKGKGVITLISHYGNWEIMAQASVMDGYPVHAVMRNIKNPLIDQYVKKLRRKMGITVIEKDGAVQGAIRALKKNKIVAILIDQHERRGGVWVDFFGRPACTSGLVATLALKYNVPVIPVFHFRQDGEPDIVQCFDPLPLIRTGDLDEDIFANTQIYVKSFEEIIRERPQDWLWMHRRWRDRPETESYRMQGSNP